MEFNRFKQLLESKLGNVKPLIVEQGEIIKQGAQGDPYQYKKIGNDFYFAKKGSNDWKKATTDKSINAIKQNVFSIQTKNDVVKPNKETIKPEVNFCPVISQNSKDIEDLSNILSTYKNYNTINSKISILAKLYNKIAKFPQRISCQMALNQIRPGYKDKNLIVVDTLQKVLYVFDKFGNFIDKTVIISGADKQSLDPQLIAKSLLSWEDQAKSLGFEWKQGKGYVDVTGKNRKYDSELVYSDTKKSKTRFLPKGIFTTGGNLKSDKEYAGSKDNLLTLIKNNKEISQAIHGYYVEQPRTEALNLAKQLLNDPTNPSLTDNFIKAVSAGKINLSQSYGCINLPQEFLPTLRNYLTNSYVFNIGETGDNYLVNNTNTYFDKMINSQGCPSPKSLGAEPIIGFDSTSTGVA